jgi:hypothetical protein
MSYYSAAIAGLKTAFEAVTGIHYVLDYEPLTVQDAPMLYLVATAGTRDSTVMPAIEVYQVNAVLVIRWQDNEGAEQEVIDLLPLCLAALDTDPTLGGVLGGGAAWIPSYSAGYQDVSGQVYRIIEFMVDIHVARC